MTRRAPPSRRRVDEALAPLLALVLAGCGPPRLPPAEGIPLAPVAAEVVELLLEGPITSADAEISGLAWHGDLLVLLPQFPDRFGAGEAGGALFAIPRAELERSLREDGGSEPLRPRRIAFDGGGLGASIDDFEGFEAIAFDGDRVFLTVEAGGPRGARGFIVRGSVDAGGARIAVDPGSAVEIAPQVGMPNLAYEALVLDDEGLLAIHEVNAPWLNPGASARAFSLDLERGVDLAMAPLEHRVTDATDVDGAGRFWVVNYQWRGGAALRRPGEEAVAVERLVELTRRSSGIAPTGRAIDLGARGEGRNWEGIARLGEGLLLATDRYPRTILGFVPPGG